MFEAVVYTINQNEIDEEKSIRCTQAQRETNVTESRLAKCVLEKDTSEMLREYGAAEKRNRDLPLSDGELCVICAQ
ncbi:hypothetical protein AYW79_10520 [Ferroacidibacillus organovorans]|uniref:Uncharacterized protein n=1 Tax=Ferroacidibacillus organovorans TaxID=1765683 RepID=A0A162T8V5_9BACL|nr:hypothetical protein AYJ22_10950 [Ferroacidibacillus organovorans]OAG93457.1 hypothetical protein AYW79_10520 [Ferroacidibacillus organovorans]OPG17074.1 hypothetical protein B2M26_03505 [Ferroacidibacillus organovorans]